MQALAGTPDEWYPVPAGVHQIGQDYYLPGTETLPKTLAQPWPQCKLPDHYNPYTLTYAQITVDGVYCIINKPAPPPAPAPTPSPSPTPICIGAPGQCKPGG
jgi:hypothetical protein